MDMNTTELEAAIAEQSNELEELSARLEAVELNQIQQVADAITMLEYLKERSPHGASDAELSKLVGDSYRTTKATLMVLGLAEIVRAANSGPKAMYLLTRYAEGTEASLSKLRDQGLYKDLPFPGDS
jgi:uncharacterized coiled-coil protein SlyX